MFLTCMQEVTHSNLRRTTGTVGCGVPVFSQSLQGNNVVVPAIM